MYAAEKYEKNHPYDGSLGGSNSLALKPHGGSSRFDDVRSKFGDE
jgi:hypothetical protein